MTLDNLNRDIEEIINKWINKGLTEKEIQNSVVNVLKQKTNYDEDFIMLIDDKSDDNMSKRLLEMENHLNKIYSKLEVSYDELFDLKQKNLKLQNLVDSMNNEINKPSFIKDVDKTITGLGKELEKGIYSFGQFIGNFVEENIDFNESDKGCKEMDI